MPAIAAIVGVAMAASSKPDRPAAVVDQTQAPPPVDATQGTPPVETNQPGPSRRSSAAPAETKAPPVETKPAVETKRPLAKKHVVEKEPSPAVPVTTHRVDIGAQPYWSYFTVDDDPAQHTTGDPLQLAPGAHTLHFTGNPHYAADKTITIDVPDADGFKTVVQLAGRLRPRELDGHGRLGQPRRAIGADRRHRRQLADLARDQARAALERQERPRPLDHHEHAAAIGEQVHDVDERPHAATR